MAKRLPLSIGIVGCSAEGAALCYRTVCAEGAALLGPDRHPEVALHTHSLGEYMELIDRDDWAGVAELMLSSAAKLAAAGAEILICPDNTIHRAFPLVAARSPLPWLHIMEEVAREAAARGFRKVAITGTRYTMEGGDYPAYLAKRGIAALVPGRSEREEINGIIFDELVHGRFSADSATRFCAIIGRMRAEGCDAVVLGCTEIPLLVTPEISPLPVLDSTRLLARAALRRSVGAAGGAPGAGGTPCPERGEG